jgi:hypothetical protein
MGNNLDPELILSTLSKEFDFSKDKVIDIFNKIKSDHKLSDSQIKYIFKILLHYTYKLKTSEIELNKTYQSNFNEINEALRQIKVEMKKIIKQSPSEEPAPEIGPAPAPNTSS